MAWTGVATVTALGRNVVRITGVSLGANSSGTIGLSGGSGDVSLPSTFPSASDGAGLTMADIVQVSYVHEDAGGGANESRHIHVDKASTPFLITFTNDQNQASSPLEIYVQYHHSASR